MYYYVGGLALRANIVPTYMLLLVSCVYAHGLLKTLP